MKTLVVTAVLVGALTGCTGSASDPKPTASASASAATGAGVGASTSVAELNQQYLARPADVPVLATVKGTVRDGRGDDHPGTLDLLAVQAGTGSTAVRWRLSSDRPISSVSTNYYHVEGRAVPDTSAVALVAKSADLRLDSATWAGTGPFSGECTCAWNPSELGPEGVELSSLYPALPADVTEAELRVPGFPAVSAAPTRQ